MTHPLVSITIVHCEFIQSPSARNRSNLYKYAVEIHAGIFFNQIYVINLYIQNARPGSLFYGKRGGFYYV